MMGTRALLGCVLLACAFAGAATAHTQTGALGASDAATDYYHVTCSDDGSGVPASLALELRDEGPVGAPLLSVQIFRGTELVNATDPDDTDAHYSPLISVNGGAGVYHVLVDKSGAGGKNYRV